MNMMLQEKWLIFVKNKIVAEFLNEESAKKNLKRFLNFYPECRIEKQTWFVEIQ